ncbi:hypothetical protein NL447_27035, partial [Klebsiella pneumoniae]|nr:hypothetical protein [Klebsiella pneumoniae]
MSESILVIGAPDLLAEKAAWLDELRDTKRSGENTLEAYERDARQFLAFMTSYLGRPTKLSDLV